MGVCMVCGTICLLVGVQDLFVPGKSPWDPCWQRTCLLDPGPGQLYPLPAFSFSRCPWSCGLPLGCMSSTERHSKSAGSSMSHRQFRAVQARIELPRVLYVCSWMWMVSMPGRGHSTHFFVCFLPINKSLPSPWWEWKLSSWAFPSVPLLRCPISFFLHNGWKNLAGENWNRRGNRNMRHLVESVLQPV